MNAHIAQPHVKKALAWRIMNWIDYIFLGIIVLAVLLLCGITWWLTPSRLSNIIDTQASQRLNADVHTGDVSFTIWSSFPHLRIQTDSIYIRSRNFDSVSSEMKASLPDNADFLVSTGAVSGGINIPELLAGKIMLHDVSVSSLKLNLVAMSDSLNNYDIVPATGSSEVPYFNIDTLRFVNGGVVAYYSHASDTKARIALSEASLMPRKGKNNYHLLFKGNISAASDGLALLRNFPFELDGDINFRFKPFGVTASDYSVNFGQVKGNLGIDLDFGENTRLNKFDYHLTNFSLSDLKALLPDNYADFLKRLDANLLLEATARLTSPYNFSSGLFPSVEVDFNVPDGEIGYTFADNRRYAVHNVGMSGRFVYDGSEPAQSFLDVSDIHMSGFGSVLNGSARLTDLTSVPHVSLSFSGHGDLGRVSSNILALKPFRLTGTADFKADMKFRLEGSNIRESGLKVDVKSDNIGVSLGGYNVALKNLHATSGDRLSDVLSWDAAVDKMPLNMKLTADKALVSEPSAYSSYLATGVRADGKLGRLKSKEGLHKLDLNLSGASLAVNSGGVMLNIGDLDMGLTAAYLDKPVKTPDYAAPASWYTDNETMGRVNHSPQFLRVSLPANLRDIMAHWKARMQVKSGRGDLSYKGYDLSLADMDIDASFDSIAVNRLSIAHGATRGDLKANVGNLRQFINSSTPAPLLVDARIALDTVQVNQLAHDYLAAHPSRRFVDDSSEDKVDSNDSIAVILPRNILAHVHASAMQTRYTNLHLYDLWTDMSLKDGIANLDTLHISADFGQAGLSMLYDTSNLQDLKLGACLNVYDVDVVRFFNNFHKLLVMWPEMKNLSGTLSVRLDGNAHLFPSMYVNPPSLWANAHIEGVGLKLHQNKFIRHLANMMLINQEGDIDIEDIKLHAVVHSNLIEVFPTAFEVSKYRLVLMGLNNFNGDLFYHVGVEDWPLKIPFGVNIKGNYSKPILKFGGRDWHDRNGAMITGGVQDYDRFNLVTKIKKYSADFIRSAATYTGD